MKDQNISNITQEFNKKLQDLNNTSNSVKAYLGLLYYRRNYFKTIGRYKKGSIEEKMFQDSFLKQARENFPDIEFSSIEDAVQKIEELAKPAIELNEQYKAAIKSYYISSGLELNAVRVASPEQLGR